jgi:catechol 2,3-dioxygenase-like lactoylglutathione lyase family enzyme
MRQSLNLVSLVVSDYDEAIAWFTGKLGFTLDQDVDQGNKRWVVVAPRGGSGARLLLARASDEDQKARIGDQTGGRVFLFLETDDFDRDHAAMTSKGVRFLEEPRREPYGTVAVFEDLCGNKWDMIQPKA